ncbi:tetratricopeptide repeat protein [Streptosporangium saharense]|uniref:Sel1 repeat family protein n=1 Tax=Streptosporangium saharense TaxID=1706840 RepID=A0A7W7QIV2_9ACTN|nr:tetratricopeptide repeat protein [Streptosporangium saharense]MBB4914410.1 hypothetical protein [Streptosporangium saharense]
MGWPEGTEAARRRALLCEDAGDLDAARRWHREAASGGDLTSAHDLGSLAYGRGEEDEALRWWELAARGGHTGAAYELGLFLQANRDPEGAEACYLPAAGTGHPGAASRLGGLVLARGDLRAARVWFERAAGAGRTGDQRMAGFVCLELGDVPAARRWFGRAAAGGDPEGAFTLGLLLIAEDDDLPGGLRWLRRAAQTGHRRAAAEVASLLSRRPLFCEPPARGGSDLVVEPELAARAELASAVAGRGGVPLRADDLAEILGTWDLLTRSLRDHADVAGWLAGRSGLPQEAIERLGAVRAGVARPRGPAWPSPAEVGSALVTARELWARLGRTAGAR